jgi:hypothetical protein
MNRIVIPTAAALLVFAGLSPVRAEVFVLAGGGRVTGELLNRDESPRRQYVIQVADGARVTLDAAQVRQVLRPRPEEIEYERIRPTYADTPEAQWDLAQWCREHRLTAQREEHLRRVIELDPNHAEARHALGYAQIDGKWQTRAEVMTERGYKLYKGQWRLQQEIDLAEKKRKQDAAQQDWMRKLKLWRTWLAGDRRQQATDNIRAISDPAAIKGLVLGLQKDSSPPARLLYAEALGKLDTLEAARALAIASISDAVEEIRLSCLDYLQTKPRPEVVAYYVGKLKDKDNQVVNLAAIGLSRMKDPSAIGPLIEALVTIHKFKIVKQGGDNAMNGSFGTGPRGTGGTSFSAGGGPTIIRQPISNQAVLDALVALTGQNFNFDKQAWKYWYAAQKKPRDALDARRN